MKLENVAVESMDLVYENPLPDTSLCVFEEGIQKQVNASSGKTTVKLPLKIIGPGPEMEENMDRKFSHFLPIQTNYGERQLQSILSMVGLLDHFINSFQGEFDPLDDMFIIALQKSLPGRKIIATHELKKNNKGKDVVNVVRFEKCTSIETLKFKPLTGGKATVTKTETGSEDW